MKSTIYSLIIIGIYFPMMSHAQTGCNAGNESPGFIDPGIFGSNALLGVKFNVPTSGTLNSLNLWGLGTNANVQMALYNDSSGIPTSLFISSAQGTVTNGIVSLSVTPTFISPGNYWLMAIYDSSGGHTYRTTSGTGSVFYQPLLFGSAIPANASGFITYCCRDFHYWMQIACISGIDQLYNFSAIRIFPNPSMGLINIDFESTSFAGSIDIINSIGKFILHKEVSRIKGKVNIDEIDLSDYPKGIYFVKINDGNKIYTEKIVIL